MTAVLPVRQAPERARVAVVLVGLILGVSLAALDLTVVATSVRTIADDLGGLDLQAWATTTYLIAGAVTTPLYGKLSDLFGRKPLFLVAISVFVAGSMLCTLSGSMYELAAYRAVQGLGAGGLFSLSMTIVSDIVPPRERARYVGYLITVYGVFGVLGPVVGGLLAGTQEILGVTGWRWVFLVNVPVGLLALAVVAVGLRLPRTRSVQRVDWGGAATLAIGLVPLLVIADEGRKWGWTSYEAWLCYLVGAAGLGAFLLVERAMGDDALLPLQHFARPNFRLGAIGNFAVGFGMFGVITALPLYLQVVGGASPAEAGLLMMPLVVGILVTSSVSGKAIERTGRYRVWPVFGSTLMIVGLLWLSAITDRTSFLTTAVFMLAFGVGLGGNLQPLTLAMQNAVPASEAGVATAASTFFRSLGGSAGAAVFLSILFSTVGERIAGAFREAAATPAFRAVVADPAVAAQPADRAVLDALRGGGDGVGSALLEDSTFLAQLHPELAAPFLGGFAESTSLVFTVGAVVTVLALAAAIAMDDVVVAAGGAAPPPVAVLGTAAVTVPVVPVPAAPVPAALVPAALVPAAPAPAAPAAPVHGAAGLAPAAPASHDRRLGTEDRVAGGGPSPTDDHPVVPQPQPQPQPPRPSAPPRPAAPLLAHLPPAAREMLVRVAVPSLLPAGTRLFAQGDHGDTAYLVRSGRVEALVDGEPVRGFGAGDVFGELALLGDGVRTATVVARRDSELLAVRRTDFDRLLATEPAFARALVTRLAARVPGPDVPDAPVAAVVALVPAHPEVEPGVMARLGSDLGARLARSGRVARLDPDGDPTRWATRLAEAEATHDRVLLVAREPGDAWTRFCLRVADRPLLVADTSQPAPTGRRLPASTQLVAVAHGPLHAGLGRWLDALTPSTHHLVDLAAADPDIARLARRVSARSVGLVLSGGGARGLAHIGVVDVLRRAGLVIDRVGGTSMGAVVAGLVALGLDAGEMVDTARRELVGRRPFGDVVWPRHSLTRGGRVRTMLERVYGDALIEEQLTSLFTVSVDLIAAETVVHRRGRIADAVAASVRLPGIAPPLWVGGRLHVDGAVLDNLPVAAMAGDGEGPVVACDVAPRFDATFGGSGRLPGLVETLGRSMTLAGSQREADAYAEAHTMIAPDLTDLGLFEFARLDELVERGRRAAEQALPGLRDLLP